MRQPVFNSYSKAHNKRYWHSGTLFEGNYKVKPVADTTYLLHLCRYIHYNPVQHGLVTDPADWPYSNFVEWIDRPHGSMVDTAFVKSHFPTTASYQEFMLDDHQAVYPSWP